MSDPVPAVPAVEETQNAAPATGEEAAPNAGGAQEITGNTTFSSIGDLKRRAPVVFEKFMEGIAMTIIDDMKKSANRVKEAMKKIRQK